MKNNWKLVLIIGAGVVAVILLCVFGIQSSQNKAFALEEQVNTAQSDIKVQEKRRVDLVYNLADCVKQYDRHEAETLTAIVEGRGSTGDIENVTTAITAVSEAYPELKSNENYKQLMNELSMTENLIAEYRSNYNKQIKVYNSKRAGNYDCHKSIIVKAFHVFTKNVLPYRFLLYNDRRILF